MLGKLVSIARDLTEKIPIGKSELEKMLYKVTSSETYMAGHDEIYSIVERTYHYEDREVIMQHVWNRLELPSSEWRKIYKAGDPECVTDIKGNSFKLKMLENFSYKEEGIEKGTGVCDKAANINRLLNDPEALSEEREKSKTIRSKVFGEGASMHMTTKTHFPEESRYDPESQYESPKEHFKKSKEVEKAKEDWREDAGKKLKEEPYEPEVEEKPRKKKKERKPKKEEPPKPKLETFDLLQLVEDVPEQKKESQELLQIFGSTPPREPIPKQVSGIEDLLSVKPIKPVSQLLPQTKPEAKKNVTSLQPSADPFGLFQSPPKFEPKGEKTSPPKNTLWEEAEDLFEMKGAEKKSESNDFYKALYGSKPK